ncbi:MAG: hypothetical protein ACE5OR_04720 [bacterium]
MSMQKISDAIARVIKDQLRDSDFTFNEARWSLCTKKESEAFSVIYLSDPTTSPEHPSLVEKAAQEGQSEKASYFVKWGHIPFFTC